MENKQTSIIDLIIKTHVDLERQGPGSSEMTIKALSFLNNLNPEFINAFNDNAKKLNLQERVNGIVGSIENLSFQKEEFDLIWSETA